TERLLRISQQTRSLHEIVNTERRRKACSPSGWQHVVWTSDVITNRFGRVGAEENRTCVSNLRTDSFVILRHNLDVLRCKFIHDRTGFIQRLNQDDTAELFQRRLSDLASRQ